jgi:uncharacterized protein (TIGR00251 family)
MCLLLGNSQDERHPTLENGAVESADFFFDIVPPLPAPRIEQSGNDVLLWIKAVPGASRDQIGGTLGDRLKIRITAPPEAGRANDAIGQLLARTLKIKPRQITIETGASSPEKTVRIQRMNVDLLRATLGVKA